MSLCGLGGWGGVVRRVIFVYHPARIPFWRTACHKQNKHFSSQSFKKIQGEKQKLPNPDKGGGELHPLWEKTKIFPFFLMKASLMESGKARNDA